MTSLLNRTRDTRSVEPALLLRVMHPNRNLLVVDCRKGAILTEMIYWRAFPSSARGRGPSSDTFKLRSLERWENEGGEVFNPFSHAAIDA